MAEKVVVMVDNSNMFIEGKRYAGVRGMYSWRIDFGRRLMAVARGRTVYKAMLVGSKPPPSDGVWQAAQDGGFEVRTHMRDSQDREKAVDTELAVWVTRVVSKAPEIMDLAIVSGDRDFIPMCIKLVALVPLSLFCHYGVY